MSSRRILRGTWRPLGGALVLAALLPACGDDVDPSGSGGGGGSGASTSSGGAVEGTVTVRFVNEAPEPVTVTYDGPGEAATIAALGETSPLELNLRACTELEEPEGLCAHFDFGTLAGPSVVAALVGDAIVVLGPQAIEAVRSELELPGEGEAVVKVLTSASHPEVRGRFGVVDADGAFVPFGIGFDPEDADGQRVAVDLPLAFEQLDETLVTLEPPFVSGGAYTAIHTLGPGADQASLRVCSFDGAAPCATTTVDLAF